MLFYKIQRLRPFFIFLLSFQLQAQISGKVVDDLVIGSIFPHSGVQSQYGEEARLAIKIALDDFFIAFPNLAKSIRLIEADDKSSPKGAKDAASVLNKERVSVLIGSAFPPNSQILAVEAESLQIPLVIPGFIGLSSSPYVFRSGFAEKWQGVLLANFASKELGADSAVVLADETEQKDIDLANEFTQTLNGLGQKKVFKEFYSLTPFNIEERLDKIMSLPPKVLYFPSSKKEHIRALSLGLKKHKYKGILLSSQRVSEEAFKSQLISLPCTVYFVLPYLAENLQFGAQNNFLERFKKELKRLPSSLAALCYDGTIFILSAYVQAGTARKSEYLRAMAKAENMRGLLGEMNMGKEHFMLKPAAVLKLAANGGIFQTLAIP